MGTLRKMGAFLGLVPDQHDAEGRAGYAADEYDAGYAGYDRGYPGEAGYDDAEYAGGYEQDAGYAAAQRDGRRAARRSDAYAQAYEADPYGADGYATDPYGRPAAGGYPAAGDPEAADGDLDAARAPELQPAGGLARADRGRRGAGRDADAYQTQGALAVQPQHAPIDREVGAGMDVTGTAGKPATVRLTGFADAREVGETYRDGQAVILDMTDLTDAEARRMVDFAAGLAFAARGSIDKVTTKVFMLHPPTVDGQPAE